MSTPTNEIKKHKIASLGYNFVPAGMLPEGKDEYYLRNLQNNGIEYRQLTAYEIEVLVRNRNTSDNWNNIYVSDAFNPELVKNCKFFGLVRIGKLEPFCLEFSDLKVPVGLYNSTIISSDFGDNVVIDNVNYLSHYIIGNEVIIVNVNELVTSNYAKFGNGIVKEQEEENIRIWLELCNENGGRKVIPFNGMLPGDAYLWTRHRDDKVLQEKFKTFTESIFDEKRGYYGKIGDRTVIKNSKIVKDVWIGTDAYIKGANKLKNLTINSGPNEKSQIGEGCEMVNGIMGFGCRAFYGVKAVRFIMASHSQLKYGARLINSYLGENSTISCCEVLNSLIFPAHEQHHNNSFLCASMIMGQSNIAAGVTIGSNHNSRGADGEIVAGRGFWPGLCVSLKHNSKFASFTILAKGDYPSELNIPIPFSLVNNDVANNQLVIMPGYWFMYNMYALERNTWKYVDRDKRIKEMQQIEYEFLAPDTINEMLESLVLLQKFTGDAFFKKMGTKSSEEDCISKGKELLDNHDIVVNELEILASGFENSKRKVLIVKTQKSYDLFKELIGYYCFSQKIMQLKQPSDISNTEISASLKQQNSEVIKWTNVGGQLITEEALNNAIENIKSGSINNWDDIHSFYKSQMDNYTDEKYKHALVVFHRLTGENLAEMESKTINQYIDKTVATREWMAKGIYDSKKKDYANPYRQMVYDNNEEMNEVLGSLENNGFINSQREAFELFKTEMENLKKTLQIAETVTV